MRYLFFDIECACVYKYTAKMCAFGYVVTDENFNVLEREDILMNPKGKFHLTDRKGKEGLVLPYTYEDFAKYPLFKDVYPRIVELFKTSDFICGHATVNDVNYLNLETKRYHLPSFHYRYYDTQFIYMNIVGSYANQFGLQAMAEALGVEFTPHRAVDDAYATMRVCEAMCKKEGVSVEALVEKYKIKPGKIENYNITLGDSLGRKNYLAEKDAEREKRARAHEEFFHAVNRHQNRKYKGTLEGKVFCFSKDIEEDVPFSVQLVSAIFKAGGKYTSHPASCNVYIAKEQSGLRCKNALDAGAAFVALDDLKASLEGV